MWARQTFVRAAPCARASGCPHARAAAGPHHILRASAATPTAAAADAPRAAALSPAVPGAVSAQPRRLARGAAQRGHCGIRGAERPPRPRAAYGQPPWELSVAGEVRAASERWLRPPLTPTLPPRSEMARSLHGQSRFVMPGAGLPFHAPLPAQNDAPRYTPRLPPRVQVMPPVPEADAAHEPPASPRWGQPPSPPRRAAAPRARVASAPRLGRGAAGEEEEAALPSSSQAVARSDAPRPASSAAVPGREEMQSQLRAQAVPAADPDVDAGRHSPIRLNLLDPRAITSASHAQTNALAASRYDQLALTLKAKRVQGQEAADGSPGEASSDDEAAEREARAAEGADALDALVSAAGGSGGATSQRGASRGASRAPSRGGSTQGGDDAASVDVARLLRRNHNKLRALGVSVLQCLRRRRAAALTACTPSLTLGAGRCGRG